MAKLSEDIERLQAASAEMRRAAALTQAPAADDKAVFAVRADELDAVVASLEKRVTCSSS